MSNTANVTDRVAEKMRNNIISGEWKVGKKIPSESVLCETFACSRTSIRNAIQQFKALGVLETRRGSGTLVVSTFPPMIPNETGEQKSSKYEKQYSEKLLSDWRQARYFLEPEIVRLVAKSATQENIALLKTINQEQFDCIGNQQKFVDKDREFHLAIASFLGNDILTGMLSDLLKYNDLMLICNDKFGYAGAGYYHMIITDAIEQHDAERAERLMKEHLAEVNNYFHFIDSNEENK